MKLKALITAVLVITILIGSGVVMYTMALNPVDRSDNNPIYVQIPAGYGTNQIAELLSENQLIKNTAAFRIHSRLNNLDGKMKEGEYYLQRSMAASEIANIIVEGDTIQYSFTIPEGYTVRQIAKTLSQKGFADEEEFLSAARTGQFSIPFEYKKSNLIEPLEGYLYPDTYAFEYGMDETDIISMMIKNLDKNLTDSMFNRASEMGYSMQEIITIASMIEREARMANERKIVASVIYNRLAINMPLQLCATVQYLLPEQKEVLLYSDLEIDSPYNTYRYDGIPPGPISNPGIESIKAALYPEDTPYYYFVAKKDGSHVFSKTLAEHNQAKEEIQGD